MRRLAIIAVVLVQLCCITVFPTTMAQDASIIDSELFLVSPGQTVDWKFTVKVPDNSLVTGKLVMDSTTIDPVWAVQGCIDGNCFMNEGGPVAPVSGEITCQLRLFVPSDFDGDDKHALVSLLVSIGGTEFGQANLHVLSVKSLKANFVAGEKPVQISEIKLENCVQVRTVSEHTIVSKAAPTIIKGSMMIPFRVLGEIIGAEVGWNSNTNEASYMIGSKKVVLRKDISKARIIFSGFEKSISVEPPPANVAGNIMVPLRFVTNALGGDVAWDAPTKTATVQFPGCSR